MQAVSSAFTAATGSSFRNVSHRLLVAWEKVLDPTVNFFTLDVSQLDGPDILQGIYNTVTFFDKFVYTDETPYVLDWQITRSVSQQPWGVIMATATLELDNTSNRFFPGLDPTIGDYVLLANRPVKIQVGFNGENINVFTGFTDNTTTAQIVGRKLVMNLMDAMTYLQGIKSEQSTMVNMSRDQIIISLLTEAGFTSDQWDIEPSVNSPIPYYNPHGKIMTDIFTELCESEGALMFCDENGIINWWTRPHINNHKTVQWAFDYSNTIGDPQYVTPTIINDVNVTTTPLAVGAYNKIYEVTIDPNNPTDYLVPPGSEITLEADFSGDAAAAISVDTPYWVGSSGSGNSTFTTALNADGTGGDGGGAVALSSETLTGESYLMTFTNSGTQGIYITDISLWGVPAVQQTVQTSPYIDQTSVDNYNRNPNNNYTEIGIENDTLQNAFEAQSLAYWYVQLYGQPQPRFTLATFAVPQLQAFDWVSMTPQETGVTMDLAIMASTLALEAPANLTQTLDIEGRSTFSYFILDQSKLDGPDVLAF